jgi:hypothetical protein
MIPLLTYFLKIEQHDTLRAYVDAETATLAETLVHDYPRHTTTLSI